MAHPKISEMFAAHPFLRVLVRPRKVRTVSVATMDQNLLKIKPVVRHLIMSSFGGPDINRVYFLNAEGGIVGMLGKSLRRKKLFSPSTWIPKWEPDEDVRDALLRLSDMQFEMVRIIQLYVRDMGGTDVTIYELPKGYTSVEMWFGKKKQAA